MATTTAVLEARVKEFDPLYRGYPWGRKKPDNSVLDGGKK